MWFFILTEVHIKFIGQNYLVVLFGFNYFEDKPEKQTVSVPLTPEITDKAIDMVATDVLSEQVATDMEEQSYLETVRISVKNNFVSGSFLANGTKTDDLQLSEYRETTQPDSAAVSLLNNSFKTQLNWQGNLLPDMTKTPVVQGQELTPETPVVLTWKKGDVVVERTISLDNAYKNVSEDIKKRNTGLKYKLSDSH